MPIVTVFVSPCFALPDWARPAECFASSPTTGFLLGLGLGPLGATVAAGDRSQRHDEQTSKCAFHR